MLEDTAVFKQPERNALAPADINAAKAEAAASIKPDPGAAHLQEFAHGQDDIMGSAAGYESDIDQDVKHGMVENIKSDIDAPDGPGIGAPDEGAPDIEQAAGIEGAEDAAPEAKGQAEDDDGEDEEQDDEDDCHFVVADAAAAADALVASAEAQSDRAAVKRAGCTQLAPVLDVQVPEGEAEREEYMDRMLAGFGSFLATVPFKGKKLIRHELDCAQLCVSLDMLCCLQCIAACKLACHCHRSVYAC